MELLVHLGSTYLVPKLKEPSTWRGLAVLAGIWGWSVSPELLQEICSVVVAVIGLIEVIRKEKR